MKLSILYNWPLGKESARVSLGFPNIEDNKYQFRLGIIDCKGSGGWVKPGWVSSNDAIKLNASIEKDWKIRLEKKLGSTDVPVVYEFDCSKDWPSGASGSSCTDTSYWI